MHVGLIYRLSVPLKLGSESWEPCPFNCPQAQISNIPQGQEKKETYVVMVKCGEAAHLQQNVS
jgi:hypothetical protein